MTEDKDTDNKVTRIKSNLTAKQEKFIEGVAKGLSASEAYRQAYNTKNMKDSSIWTESSLLMSNQKVSQRLKAIYKKREDTAVASAVSLRSWILERLQAEAKNQDNNESARIRALELLGKTNEIKLFSEVIENVNVDKSADQIKTELEERIAKLIVSNNN
tara:strand:- start:9 stop:488 length:480 start_codon:yes stop_codon:yes gene_type:complete